MMIDITVNKVLNIYDLVKKIIYTASTHDFAIFYGDKYYY